MKKRSWFWWFTLCGVMPLLIATAVVTYLFEPFEVFWNTLPMCLAGIFLASMWLCFFNESTRKADNKSIKQ